MAVKEISIVHAIEKEVRATYPKAWVRKLADRYTRGLPDLLIVLPGGTVVFVEVKRDDGRLAKLQAHNAFTVNRLGANWFVTTSVREVMTYIQGLRAW
jgi:Holliday junction resolvase-like predicted endonuclease